MTPNDLIPWIGAAERCAIVTGSAEAYRRCPKIAEVPVRIDGRTLHVCRAHAMTVETLLDRAAETGRVH